MQGRSTYSAEKCECWIFQLAPFKRLKINFDTFISTFWKGDKKTTNYARESDKKRVWNSAFVVQYFPMEPVSPSSFSSYMHHPGDSGNPALDIDL